jgi:hypothetical protein
MSRWKRIATRSVQTSALRDQSARAAHQLAARLQHGPAGQASHARQSGPARGSHCTGKLLVPGLTNKEAK